MPRRILIGHLARPIQEYEGMMRSSLLPTSECIKMKFSFSKQAVCVFAVRWVSGMFWCNVKKDCESDSAASDCRQWNTRAPDSEKRATKKALLQLTSLYGLQHSTVSVMATHTQSYATCCHHQQCLCFSPSFAAPASWLCNWQLELSRICLRPIIIFTEKILLSLLLFAFMGALFCATTKFCFYYIYIMWYYYQLNLIKSNLIGIDDKD